MGKYAGTIYTLADAAHRKDPSLGATIEVLSETNEILNDVAPVECNSGEVHKTRVRDSIPKPGHRMLNQGSVEGKSGVRLHQDGTCQSSITCPIDLDMLTKATSRGVRNEFLLGEAQAFLEGLNQAFVDDIFYGDMGVDPAGIDGFAKRYNTIDPAKFISRNVVDMRGTGANLTSIYLVQWGDAAAQIIYPEGSAGGLRFELTAPETLVDDEGLPFRGQRLWYYWNYGLAIRDWRRVVRIANIDVSGYETLVRDGAATPAQYELQRRIAQAWMLLPSHDRQRTFIYANNAVISMLNILAGERGAAYNFDIGERRLPEMYAPLGIPMRRVDGIIVGEDQVTA